MIRLSTLLDMITATAVSTASIMGAVVPLEIGGILTTISLILFLSMTELLSGSGWWDRWVSSTLAMGVVPFVIVFCIGVFSKVQAGL